MKKTKIIRIVLFLLIVAWAVLVFYMSSQVGEESSGVSRKIAELFTKDENRLEIVEKCVRKFAHFSEYALGGVLFLLLFFTYEWSERRKLITSILIGAWYAVTDEVYQLMVDGRNGSIIDVYIDTLGVSTGVCITLLIIKIVLIIKNKTGKNK